MLPSIVTASYGTCVFKLARNCWTVFQSGFMHKIFGLLTLKKLFMWSLNFTECSVFYLAFLSPNKSLKSDHSLPDQELANFFCKDSDSNLGFMTYMAVVTQLCPLYFDESHKQYINEWAWLWSTNILFTKTRDSCIWLTIVCWPLP